jgi:hypothetical protein
MIHNSLKWYQTLGKDLAAKDKTKEHVMNEATSSEATTVPNLCRRLAYFDLQGRNRLQRAAPPCRCDFHNDAIKKDASQEASFLYAMEWAWNFFRCSRGWEHSC